MKTKHTLPFISALCALLLITCKKYDEGPSMSLHTKKARLTNSWKFEKVFGTNGADITGLFATAYFEFQKDGSYVLTESSNSETGIWEFASDKEDIVFTSTSGSTSSCHILRLKNNEVWLQGFMPSNGSNEYHLIPR